MTFDGRLLAGVGVMVAAVEAGSFARAAEVVGLTPSGVSRSIARLEVRVGARLFHRSPRALVLTEEGQRLHEQVAPLLAAMAEAAENVGAASHDVRGLLKISVDPWFARVVLAPRIPSLTALHPELSLEVLVSNHREEMMAGGVDLAVRFGPPTESGLVARKLLDTHIITCAAPDYLAAHGTPQTPQEVAGHDTLLFRNPLSGRPFGWEFDRAGEIVQVRVRGRVMMDDPSAALAACEAGQGLFQSFALGLEPWLKSGRLVQVLHEWAGETYPLYVFYPARAQPSAKVRAFVDFLDRLSL